MTVLISAVASPGLSGQAPMIAKNERAPEWRRPKLSRVATTEMGRCVKGKNEVLGEQQPALPTVHPGFFRWVFGCTECLQEVFTGIVGNMDFSIKFL